MIKKIFYIGAIAALACGGCYLFNRSRKEREIEPIASREAKKEDRIPSLLLLFEYDPLSFSLYLQ